MGMSEAARRRLMGTSADDNAPWSDESWGKAMDPLAGCPDHLKEQVKDYAQRRHGRTSNQNLEELCRQKELSKSMVKEFRFENQSEITGEGPDRVGNVLHCLTFLEKLNTIVPAYLASSIYRGTCGLAVKRPGPDPKDPKTIIDWQYVCSVQVGFMHEWSTIYVDAHGLPLNHKWIGWRGTVLLRLITGGYISEQEAHRVFGEPTSGSASRSYREQLWRYRNRQEK